MVTSESDPSSIAAYATSLRYIFKPGALLDLVLTAPQATHSPTLVHQQASTCTSEPWCFTRTSPLADVHVQHSLIQPHSSDGTALAASSPARALGALSDDDPHPSLRALLRTYNLGDFSEDLIASGVNNTTTLLDSFPSEIADILRARGRSLLPVHRKSISDLIAKLNPALALPPHDKRLEPPDRVSPNLALAVVCGAYSAMLSFARNLQHSLIQPHSPDGTALAASSPARALGALSDDDPHARLTMNPATSVTHVNARFTHSLRIASHHLASHRNVSHRIASHHNVSHRIASHRILSHRSHHSLASYRIASSCIASYRIASSRITSQRITSYRIASPHLASHHIAPHRLHRSTRKTNTLTGSSDITRLRTPRSALDSPSVPVAIHNLHQPDAVIILEPPAQPTAPTSTSPTQDRPQSFLATGTSQRPGALDCFAPHTSVSAPIGCTLNTGALDVKTLEDGGMHDDDAFIDDPGFYTASATSLIAQTMTHLVNPALGGAPTSETVAPDAFIDDPGIDIAPPPVHPVPDASCWVDNYVPVPHDLPWSQDLPPGAQPDPRPELPARIKLRHDASLGMAHHNGPLNVLPLVNTDEPCLDSIVIDETIVVGTPLASDALNSTDAPSRASNEPADPAASPCQPSQDHDQDQDQDQAHDHDQPDAPPSTDLLDDPCYVLKAFLEYDASQPQKQLAWLRVLNHAPSTFNAPAAALDAGSPPAVVSPLDSLDTKPIIQPQPDIPPNLPAAPTPKLPLHTASQCKHKSYLTWLTPEGRALSDLLLGDDALDADTLDDGDSPDDGGALDGGALDDDHALGDTRDGDAHNVSLLGAASSHGIDAPSPHDLVSQLDVFSPPGIDAVSPLDAISPPGIDAVSPLDTDSSLHKEEACGTFDVGIDDNALGGGMFEYGTANDGSLADDTLDEGTPDGSALDGVTLDDSALDGSTPVPLLMRHMCLSDQPCAAQLSQDSPPSSPGSVIPALNWRGKPKPPRPQAAPTPQLTQPLPFLLKSQPVLLPDIQPVIKSVIQPATKPVIQPVIQPVILRDIQPVIKAGIPPYLPPEKLALALPDLPPREELALAPPGLALKPKDFG